MSTCDPLRDLHRNRRVLKLSRERALPIRMSALPLDGYTTTDAVGVVRRLRATQGQDFGAVKWAIPTRSQASSLDSKRTAIETAFNTGRSFAPGLCGPACT